jgi:uncharacterized protein (TIGR03437 family)
MKFIAAILLSASALCAQTFLTGQSARAVIGQANFTAQAYDNPGLELGGVSGLAYAGGSLFVVDSNRVGSLPDNDRVVIYPNISTPPYVAGLTLPSPTQEIIEENFISFIRCPVCVVNEGVIIGQPDNITVGANLTQSGLNEPAGVASNGQILVIADTNNNRVLIWNSIPQTDNAPANIVLGQTGFSSITPPTISQTAMRGPESVWIQGNQLFVADTLNNRILIWNTIPTQNNQPADVVLGQPNFTTTQSASITETPVTSASDIISPTGVSSDGTHLFVADLGQNRVLIWNSIPTQNNQPADVEIGQPNMTTAVPNNSFSGSPAGTSTDTTDKEVPVLCTVAQVNFNDAAGNPTYPQRCAYTLNFPRYVLSDGTRLFIADSGNDRVLVYNTIPTSNAAAADVALGEPDFVTDIVSDSGDATDNVEISGADSIRTPMALAWDGTNLYVSDPFDRRVVVYSASSTQLAPASAFNAASLETFASALFSFAGTITTGNVVNITITDPNNVSSGYVAPVYTYTVAKNDTFDDVDKGLASAINNSNCTTVNGASVCTGDPVVFARPEIGAASVVLSARNAGANGNGLEFSITLTGTSGAATTLVVTPASGSTTGGTYAAQLAPGALISVFGSGFTDQPATGAPGGVAQLPETLAGVELYIDGVRAPLLFASATQINAQVPFAFSDANGSTAWVRTTHADGSVTATNAIAFPLAVQVPGIFTLSGGTDPRPAMAFQSSSNALAVIDIEGLPGATSVGSVTIGPGTYTYTVQTADVTTFNVSLTNTTTIGGTTATTTTTNSVTPDVLEILRQNLVNQINADPNAVVTAAEGSQFHYLILTANASGAAGNGIAVTTTATPSSSTSLTMTVLTTNSAGATATCCASNGGTLISVNNPAIPGGFLTIYATGLGALTDIEQAGQICPVASATYPDQNFSATGVVCSPPPPPPATGTPYTGSAENSVTNFVSATAGGVTANVFNASLVPGSIGIYQLLLQLDSSLTTNPLTPLTIFQDVYDSNTVTIPVQAP